MKQIIPKKEPCFLCNETGFIEITIDRKSQFYEEICPICHSQKYLNVIKIVDFDDELYNGENLSL